ncbi:MAG: hypothetical protein ACE15C_13260 [Phycisphaerae bacterium]
MSLLLDAIHSSQWPWYWVGLPRSSRLVHVMPLPCWIVRSPSAPAVTRYGLTFVP